MASALLEQKNLATTWRQARTHQSKGRKRSGPVGRKSNQEKIDLDLGAFFKILAAGIAKTILIVACFYGVFVGYRFITSSPQFDINKVNWSGNKRLSTEDLASWSGPITGKNIFQLDYKIFVS